MATQECYVELPLRSHSNIPSVLEAMRAAKCPNRGKMPQLYKHLDCTTALSECITPNDLMHRLFDAATPSTRAASSPISFDSCAPPFANAVASAKDCRIICDFDRPKHRSDLSKTRLCRYHSRSRCRYGSECKFAHDREELRDQPDLTKTRMCSGIKDGTCQLDPSKCAFAHSKKDLRGTSDCFKTDLCSFWITGYCKAGAVCRHAHGESEKRTPIQLLSPPPPVCPPPQQRQRTSSVPPPPPVTVTHQTTAQIVELKQQRQPPPCAVPHQQVPPSALLTALPYGMNSLLAAPGISPSLYVPAFYVQGGFNLLFVDDPNAAGAAVRAPSTSITVGGSLPPAAALAAFSSAVAPPSATYSTVRGPEIAAFTPTAQSRNPQNSLTRNIARRSQAVMPSATPSTPLPQQACKASALIAPNAACRFPLPAYYGNNVNLITIPPTLHFPQSASEEAVSTPTIPPPPPPRVQANSSI